MGNLKVIKKVYGHFKDVIIIPCFFHLTQVCWKNAIKWSLRKKSFIKDTKCIIFNLQMTAFMDYKTVTEYYKLIKEEYPDNIDEYIIFMNI